MSSHNTDSIAAIRKRFLQLLDQTFGHDEALETEKRGNNAPKTCQEIKISQTNTQPHRFHNCLDVPIKARQPF